MITKVNEFLRGLGFRLYGMLYSGCSVSGQRLRIGHGSRIELSKKSECRFNGDFYLVENCHISVRRNAVLSVGKRFFMNIGCIIVVKDKIRIGDNVQLGPYVQFYDHDHDFRKPGGLSSEQFKTAPIIVGNNVWIGAGSVVLRGTVIGDNCVIGAGSIVKGEIPANTIYVQKRTTELHEYQFITKGEMK